MALPVDVSNAVSLSNRNNRPTHTPSKSVPPTIIVSMTIADSPTATTWCNVSRKPYSTIPARRICFVHSLMPGTHVSGSRFLRLFAYSIPRIIPTISGLNDNRRTTGISAI